MTEAGHYDDDLATLNELLTLPFVSDYDKGHIYERMARLYKFQGDTLRFYHTMGNDLLSLADKNMYHSKSHGKNMVTYDENGEKIIFRES